MIKRMTALLALFVSLLVVGAGATAAQPAQAERAASDSASSVPDWDNGRPSHIGQKSAAGKALTTCPAGGCYFYAGARQTGMSPGVKSVAANFTVDDPFISSCCAYHTLMQMSLQDSMTIGTAIEWGWTRDNPTTSGTYADNHPRLFFSYWVGGVWQGYNTGFVDYAANPINVGQDLSDIGATHISHINTEKAFSVGYAAATGPSNPARWWMYYDNQPVGSIPASLIPDFDAGAAVLQVFGEVDSLDDHPCTDMSSNPPVLATSTTGARISSVTYDASAPAVNLTAITPTNSAWYNGVLQSGSVRTVRIGGGAGC